MNRKYINLVLLVGHTNSINNNNKRIQSGEFKNTRHEQERIRQFVSICHFAYHFLCLKYLNSYFNNQ